MWKLQNEGNMQEEGKSDRKYKGNEGKRGKSWWNVWENEGKNKLNE